MNGPDKPLAGGAERKRQRAGRAEVKHMKGHDPVKKRDAA